MSLELELSVQYVKSLKQREEEITFHIVNHTLPQTEYVEHVGKLSAIKECRLAFEALMKKYFTY
jgi:hypothetical protein